MLRNLLFRRIFIISLTIGIYVFLHSGLTLAASGDNASDEEVEVLIRGQLHEAFADVNVDETQPGTITPRPVPAQINEIPPEFRPEGERVEWIPGYWSWDDEKDDFIWLSGVWRVIPPGRQWISGYWVSAGSGSQYISGYWANINQPETVYLPPPPKPLETGPSSPSFIPQQIWTDGNWIWYYDRYVWQPGYWSQQRPNMIWTPAHYVWTPRGYVFVRGYWDYQLTRRGVIFAPIYYSQPVHRNDGYFYTPSIVLSFDFVFRSLFIRRGSHHYYFGNYHGHQYEKRGYTPWYSKNVTRYDDRSYHKSNHSQQQLNNSKWANNPRQLQHRRKNKDSKPTFVYGQQADHSFGPSHSRPHPTTTKNHSDVSKDGNRPPVRPRPSKLDQKREPQVQDRQMTRNHGKERTYRTKTTQKGKSWQATETVKVAKSTRSSLNITNNHNKNTAMALPQGKHANNHRVKPQLQKVSQTNFRSQKEQGKQQVKRTSKRY